MGILGKKYEQDAIFYKAEGYLPQSEIYFSYEGEEILSKYAKNNLGSIVRKKYGKGEIYSFGFYYGYSYCSKIIPHVPIEYKNDAFYPISMMKSDILHDILLRYEKPFSFNGKNIEISEFKNGVIIINHNSVPIDIKNINGQKYFQYPINETLLLPRTAVFVEY